MLAMSMPAEIAVHTTGHDLTDLSALWEYLDCKESLVVVGSIVTGGPPDCCASVSRTILEVSMASARFTKRRVNPCRVRIRGVIPSLWCSHIMKTSHRESMTSHREEHNTREWAFAAMRSPVIDDEDTNS